MLHNVPKEQSTSNPAIFMISSVNLLLKKEKDDTRKYENGSRLFLTTLPPAFVLSLADISIKEEIRVIISYKKKLTLRNASKFIHTALAKSKKVNIKSSVMFSKCNQFLPTDSKLSTAHCAKSQRGHQIHANPSLSHHMEGGGGESDRATTHKHRPCTNTLPGHKARPQVWWGGTHSLQTNRTKRARSIRPSDFDLVLTHDVGQYVNSRACVSEGAGALLPGLLQHHLPTAAVAVRTTSIISIQRMQLVSTAVWALAEVQNSSTSPLSLSSSSLAQFSERAFCSGRLTMMKTTGNLWTHWQGG